MKKEYLDKNGCPIKGGDILMNEDGELMLVIDNGDDLGINASRPGYMERTGCSELYLLSNFGGLALMDMRHHLREWAVVGTNSKLVCSKCGAWLAEPQDAYPILFCSSDYVGGTICRCCKEELNAAIQQSNENVGELRR